jgi:hypothetical protein
MKAFPLRHELFKILKENPCPVIRELIASIAFIHPGSYIILGSIVE